MTRTTVFGASSRIGWLVAVVLLAAPVAASAQTRTWTGTATTAWSSGGPGNNWNGDPAPAGGEDILFNDLSTANLATVQDIAGLTVNSVAVGGTTGPSAAVSIGGTAGLTIAGGGITDTTQNLTFNLTGTLALSANQVWTAAATRTLTVNNTVVLDGGANVLTVGSATATGTVAVSGRNLTTGGLTLAGGTFTATNGTASTGNVTLDNSTLALANPLGRSGTTAAPVRFTGSSTLNLFYNGPSDTAATSFAFGNAVTVDPGVTATFNINRSIGTGTNKLATLGALNLGNGSTLAVNSTNSYRANFIATTHAIDGTVNISLNGQNSTIDGQIVGTNTPVIVKLGSNDLVLANSTANASNFTLQLGANVGRTFINSANALGNSTFTIGSGSTLSFQTNATFNTYAGVGSSILSGGGVSVRNGTVTLPAAGTGAIAFPSAGTFVSNNDDSGTVAYTISGAYPTLTGDLTFQFGGARNVTATNALGVVTVGSLNLGASDRVITLNYAAVASSGGATTSYLTVSGTTSGTAVGGNNLTLTGNGAATFTGAIDNTVANITKSGTGIVTFGNVANAYTGSLTVSGGQLILNAGVPLPGTTVTVTGGGFLSIGSNTLDQTFLNTRLTAGATGTIVASGFGPALDLTANPNLRLGASSLAVTGVTITNLTPGANGYLYGGGSGSLLINTSLTGTNAVNIASGGNGTPMVTFLQPNSFIGGLTLNNGALLTVFSDSGLGATGGAINLTAASRITLGSQFDIDPSRPITLGTGGGGIINTNRFNSTLAGASVTGANLFTKQGLGNLTLTTALGNAAGGFQQSTGTTTVTATSGTPLGTGTLTLTGGELAFVPATIGGAVAYTIGGTTPPVINGGIITLNRNGNTSLTVTAGAATGGFSRTNNGTLVIAPASGFAALGSTEKLIVSTQTAVTTAFTAIFVRDNDATGTGYFAINSVANGYAAQTAYTTTDINTAAANTAIVNTGPATLTAARTAFAVRATGALDLGTFALNLGATSGTPNILNAATVSNGTMALGANLGNFYTSGTSAISAVVTGTGGLTISGPGSLSLTGANTFTGGVLVGDGATLEVGTVTGGSATVTASPLGNIVNTAARTVSLRNGTFRPTVSYDPNATTIQFAIDAGGGTFDIPTGVTLTLSDASQFSGTGPLVKTGVGTVLLGNSFTYTGAAYVDNGTLAISNTSALGTGVGYDTAVRVASTGALDVRATFNKVIYLNGTGFNNNGSLITSTGTGTVNGRVELLSDTSIGGAGTLNVNGLISGAFALTKLGAGVTTLNNTGNQQTLNTVLAGSLAASNDGALGAVPGSPADNIVLNGGNFRYAAAFPVNTNRQISVLQSGNAIDTNNFSPTLAAPVVLAASVPFTKTGGGTLTLASVLANTASVTVTQTTSGATQPSVLDFNGASLTLGGLTATGGLGTAGVGGNTARITGFQNLTVNGPFTLANYPAANAVDNYGEVLIPNGSTFTVNAGGTAIALGNKTTTAATGYAYALITTPTPATDAVTLNLTGSSIELGFSNTTAAGGAVGGILLPAGSATVFNATATGARGIRVGGDINNVAAIQSVLRLGGGANTLTTPLLQVGSMKSNAILVVQPGGSVTINNGGSARTALSIANNFISTGVATTASVDFTGASSVTALFSTIDIARTNGTLAGSATGTLTIADGTTASTSGLTTLAFANASSTMPATGTLNITGGSLTLGANLAAGSGTGTGTKTATLNVSGGLLDFANNNLTAAGAGTTNFTYLHSGGTVRNLGTSARSLTQTGGTFDRQSGGSTAITGSYTLSGGTLQTTGPTGVFSTTTGLTASGTGILRGTGTVGGAVTLAAGGTISPGFSIGEMTVTGAHTWQAGGTYAWEFGVDSGPGTPGITHDHINGSAGSLTLDASVTPGTPLNVTVNPVGFTPNNPSLVPQTYTIATFSSISGYTGSNQFNVTGSGFYGTPTVFVDPSFPTLLQVTFVPTPEPASVLALCGGAVAVGGWVRRRLRIGREKV